MIINIIFLFNAKVGFYIIYSYIFLYLLYYMLKDLDGNVYKGWYLVLILLVCIIPSIWYIIEGGDDTNEDSKGNKKFKWTTPKIIVLVVAIIMFLISMGLSIHIIRIDKRNQIYRKKKLDNFFREFDKKPDYD